MYTFYLRAFQCSDHTLGFFMQVQCNVFEGAAGEVALTAGGGLRKLGLEENYEEAALVHIILA